MGITKLHFGILNLTPETTFFDHSDDTEVALIALGGHCTLLVGHNGNKANGILGERPNVFHDEACVAYIPHHTTYEMLTGETGIEVAVCKVPSYTESAAIILEAGEVIDAGETHLRIWENTLSGKAGVVGARQKVIVHFSEKNEKHASARPEQRTGEPRPYTEEEAICLHRFRDAAGVATVDITRTVETARVQLYHNDVLAVPEQDNIVALTSEGVGYQLWMQPDEDPTDMETRLRRA